MDLFQRLNIQRKDSKRIKSQTVPSLYKIFPLKDFAGLGNRIPKSLPPPGNIMISITVRPGHNC